MTSSTGSSRAIRAVVFVALVTVIGTVASLCLLYCRLRGEVNALVESQQKERDAILAAVHFTLSNDVSRDHWSVLGELIKAPHIQPELERLDVISRTGKIVYSSDPKRIGTVNNDPPVGRTYYTQEMAEEDQRRKALCLVAYSGPSRPLIPVEAGHPFRFKAATDSGGKSATFLILPEQVAGMERNLL